MSKLDTSQGVLDHLAQQDDALVAEVRDTLNRWHSEAEERAEDEGVRQVERDLEGWVITVDHGAESDAYSRVGTGEVSNKGESPSSAAPVNRMRPSEVDRLADPVRIRLRDDDGELYYEGVMSRSWLDAEEAFAFAPLHWAANNDGATELWYFEGRRTEARGWRQL